MIRALPPLAVDRTELDSMYTRPSAPQDITGVLDDAFRLYIASLKTVLPLSLLSAILSVLPQAATTVMGINPETTDFSATLAIVGIGIFIIIMMAVLVMYAGLMLQMDAFAKGQSLSSGDAVMGGLPLFLPVLVSSLLYGFGIVIGFILLLVPGIILSVYWSLFLPAAVLDKAGMVGSLARSYQLIRGSWWRTTILLTVFTLIVAVVYTILIIFAIGGVIGGMSSAGDLDTTLLDMITLIVSPILGTFMAPFSYAFLLAIHHDLVLRKEGGDLASRISNVVSA
jgi:hypothetical protein